MPRVGFNVRKKEILELVGGGVNTAEDIASETGVDEGTIRHHLVRYYRYGLLDRRGGEFIPRVGNKPYVYSLSSKGEDRIKRMETKEYEGEK